MSPAQGAVPYAQLSGYYFFYFGFIGAFSPYFTLYLQSLGLGAAAIGLLMSNMQVARIVAPSIWGWLAERTGRPMTIVRISAVAGLAGFSLFFFTTSFAGLFIAMALMAFFWSAALPLVESATFDHLGAQKHRYSRIRIWGSIGFIVTVLGIGYALDHLAIDRLLWMTALVLGGIVAFAFLLPPAPAHPHDAQPVSLRQVLRRREVRALLAACFFMSAGHGVLYVFYSIHLVEHGYGKSLVGWMWTLGVVAEIAVFLVMPRLLHRYSLRSILIVSFVAAVLRFLLIGWGADSLAMLVFAQLLHGLTFGSYHAAAIAAINAWFAGRLQPHGQALYGSLSFGAGGMLGALSSGQLWDWVGAGWTHTVASGFALVGLMLLIIGWLPGVTRTHGEKEG